MSCWMGFSVKLVVRDRLKKELSKVIRTGDWVNTKDPVIHRMTEMLPEDRQGKPVAARIGSAKIRSDNSVIPERDNKSIFDVKSGYWQFEDEWNNNGIMHDAYRYFRYTIIPYVAETIIEVRIYNEANGNYSFVVHNVVKELLENRMHERRIIGEEDIGKLIEWSDGW